MNVEIWPDPLPDLYAGEPVVLSAKVSAMTGELHLSGMFEGKPWTAALRLGDGIGGTGVAKLWARSKIAALEAKAATDLTATGIDKQIETVALEHHLVSSQTSLVAIDPLKSRPDGKEVTTTNLPVNLPDGWVYDKVFAPASGAAQRAMAPSGLNNMMAMIPAPSPLDEQSHILAFDATQQPSAPPAEATFDTSQVPSAVDTAVPAKPDLDKVDQTYPVLPLTVMPKPEAGPPAPPQGTLDLDQRIAIFLFLLAFLSVLTLILWRHQRRVHNTPRRARRIA
jgi:hypothetical protein